VKAHRLPGALWLLACLAWLCSAGSLTAQTNSNERSFQQSKTEIEKAVKAMQADLSGRLPVLDGFARASEHPLDQYRRGYYEASVDVTPAAGKCVVRVTVKVTAWYSDPQGSRSGYQLLSSNGRIESDLLDQLGDQLSVQSTSAKIPGRADANQPESAAPATFAKASTPRVDTPDSTAPAKASALPVANARSANSPVSNSPPVTGVTPNAPKSPTSQPSSSAPRLETSSSSAGEKVPASPAASNPFSQTMNQPLSAQELASARTTGAPAEKPDSALQSEFDSLQEVLKNQAHPKNLVAVKKSGTAVVDSPSLNAKPLFMASLHDEFEMLEFNRDWVHVRISGLSRGWIWRNSVEMPEGIPDTLADPGPSTATDLFHVVREETAQFPGDWEPLRGKNVKILSVQKVDENNRDAGPRQRLEYAKFLLDKSYAEVTQKSQDLAGIVVIFDSADGGMLAATVATLQQWRAGSLTDSALWHKCFFDPPEIFDSAAPSGTQ
jgi:hypothetical protein